MYPTKEMSFFRSAKAVPLCTLLVSLIAIGLCACGKHGMATARAALYAVAITAAVAHDAQRLSPSDREAYEAGRRDERARQRSQSRTSGDNPRVPRATPHDPSEAEPEPGESEASSTP